MVFLQHYVEKLSRMSNFVHGLSITTTFNPRSLACLIILVVPLEFLNLKATKPSAYLAICLLRIGPAALPYLSHSAGNFLIGSF